MAPLFIALDKEAQFNVKICVTGQHRELLDLAMSDFGINSHFDLEIMSPNQDLSGLSAKILTKMQAIYQRFKPELVLVHGDTTTSFCASLSAFYNNIKIGHVEAGLRTDSLLSPFPEEANRRLTGRLANFHFAPTNQARQNLINENVDPDTIIVTGNTVIDALMFISKKIEDSRQIRSQLYQKFLNFGVKLEKKENNILVTGHRRENFGEDFDQILDAIKASALKYGSINFIYPVHLNPMVKQPVFEKLSGINNICLIEPQDYLSFVYLMKHCKFIISDSGGIQEEAPFLGVPVLVTRKNSERLEAVEEGSSVLVGTNKDEIINEIDKFLDTSKTLDVPEKKNLYGDGTACEFITKFIMGL